MIDEKQLAQQYLMIWDKTLNLLHRDLRMFIQKYSQRYADLKPGLIGHSVADLVQDYFESNMPDVSVGNIEIDSKIRESIESSINFLIETIRPNIPDPTREYYIDNIDDTDDNDEFSDPLFEHFIDDTQYAEELDEIVSKDIGYFASRAINVKNEEDMFSLNHIEYKNINHFSKKELFSLRKFWKCS